jgi:hypothetical protein
MRWFPALLLLCSVLTAAATDYYVSPTGNDGNSGTLAAPKRTMTHALSLANAGDTVWVRGGSYAERITFPGSGAPDAPITLSAYPGETPIIDLAGVVPAPGEQPIVRIVNKSHLVFQGFTLRNWVSSSDSVIPEGILVAANSSGVVTNVRLLRNTISNIRQNDTTPFNYQANAHGIKIAGRSSSGVSHIIVEGNHVHHLKLGASEAIVVNGNVTHFKITNNHVHDCDNIAIDMIGYEGSLPATLDRARDGICAGNVVHHIDSILNPAYGYDGVSTASSYRAAAGIYADGCTRVVVERNIVWNCNYGIEVATEAELSAGATCDFVTVRNNVCAFNHQAGLIMGGYDHERGTTTNCQALNNTFYGNNTEPGSGGDQIIFQYYVTNCTFRNNVLWSPAGKRYVIGHYPDSGSDTQKEFSTTNTFSHNLYHADGGAVLFKIFTSGSFLQRSLSQWQSSAFSAGDIGSTDELPIMAESAIGIPLDPKWFAMQAASPAIDTGDPAFTAGDGELDLLGRSRVRGGRVDRGAVER